MLENELKKIEILYGLKTQNLLEAVVFIKGKRLTFYDEDTVMLSRQLGYDLNLDEIKQIPFRILISENRKDETGELFEDEKINTPVIVDINENQIEVKMSIVEPLQNLPGDYDLNDYLIAIKEVVAKDARFEVIQVEDDEMCDDDTDEDEDETEDCGDKSSSDAIEFITRFKASSFSDIILYLDQLNIELDKKAFNQLK